MMGDQIVFRNLIQEIPKINAIKERYDFFLKADQIENISHTYLHCPKCTTASQLHIREMIHCPRCYLQFITPMYSIKTLKKTCYFCDSEKIIKAFSIPMLEKQILKKGEFYRKKNRL